MGLPCRCLVALCMTPEIPRSEKQSGGHKAPHFLHAFAVCCLWTFVSTIQLLGYLSRASFLIWPDLSNSSGERKPNPSRMTTAEERRVPAQLCWFFRGVTMADGACASFAAQWWHIFADASWSEMSPLTLPILQDDPSQHSCTPALEHSLGVTPICIIAFTLK